MNLRIASIKGADTLARDYVNTLPADTNCTLAAGQKLSVTRADWEQNKNDMVDACAEYVHRKNPFASRKKGRNTCRPLIDDKYQCTDKAEEQQTAEEQNDLQAQLGKINYWPYLIAFLFVGIIIYLLTS